MKLNLTLASCWLAVLLLLNACMPKPVMNIRVNERMAEIPVLPVAILSQLPTNPNSAINPLNILVRGESVTSYKYALIADTEICALATYSGLRSVGLAITDVVTDGGHKLCVKGVDSGGVVQANATEYDWYEDNTAPSFTSFQLQDTSNGSATGTLSLTVNAVGLSSGTPTPLSYCYKTSSSTPGVADGCWSTSNPQTVAISGSTTTVYAWVKDSANNISASSSDTIPVLYPTIAITNPPSNPSSSTPLNVTVGGSYVGDYDYVITNQSTSCNVAVFPGTWTSIATAITQVPPDGLNRLCVKARTVGGIAGTSSYSHDWLQDATAPTIISFMLRDQSDNSSTGTDSATVNGVFSATGTPSPLGYCLRTASSTPAGNDACWNASSTQPVTIVDSSTVVYGWVRDAYGNMASSSDSITVIEVCDSGSLSTTCYVTSTKSLANGYLIQGSGNLVIDSGGSLTATTSASIGINMGGAITLQNGGSIAANVTTTSTDLTIGANSFINADGLGYRGGLFGSGWGTTGQGTGGGAGATYGGGGAGHGGAGSASSDGDLGGSSYGSTTTPTTWGSGGGGPSVATSFGGNGGGAIKLTVTGTLSTSGTISANGLSGSTSTAFYSGGGGAGGSIWISAANLGSATGTISANGGRGYYMARYAGAGGGGRVALNLPTPFKGTVTVDGAAGTHADEAIARDGLNGSIYVTYGNICSSGTITTTCTISDVVKLHDDYVINTTGDFIIGSGGKLQTYYETTSDLLLTTTGNITIQNGGQLVADVIDLAVNNLSMLTNASISAKTVTATTTNMSLSTGSTIASSLSARTTNLTIDQTSSLNANGKGHSGGVYYSVFGRNGQGTGGGAGATYGGGGAGHGGAGSASTDGDLGGSSYGSTTTPTTWGSGGGGAADVGADGGSGGGAIKLTVTGTLSTSGTISANGLSGATTTPFYSGGGGAGGSIWIIASTLSAATGTISANGGIGYLMARYAGAGAGGRIALDLPTPFRGNISVSGALGTNPDEAVCKDGQKGSIYLTYANICSSGTISTTCTITDPVGLYDDYVINATGDFIIDTGGNLQTYYNDQDDFSFTTSGNLTVRNGGRIAGDSLSFSVANLTMQNNARISAKSTTMTGTNISLSSSSTIASNLDLTATSMTLDSTSAINADEKGASGGAYNSLWGINGQGTRGGVGGTYAGGGGGHGGAGSTSTDGEAGGLSYGATSTPTAWGSGGGAAAIANADGGNGGGAIKLNLSGNLSTSGTISANGGMGGLVSPFYTGGGGSGGSIWIIASSLGSATGTISATGGIGKVLARYSGPGAGGRIALDLPGPFRGAINIAGGASAGGLVKNAEYGSFYTDYDNICDVGSHATACTITGRVKLGVNTMINFLSDLTLDGARIETVENRDQIYISALGDIELQNNAVIHGSLSLLQGDNITIDAGSIISANAKGYFGGLAGQPGQGLGYGVSGDGGGGAGHAGAGGGGHNGGTAGGVYGSSSTPITLGSGGGGSTSIGLANGGDGGGVIKISATDTLTIDGFISSNGSDGALAASTNYSAGGGSGGSIWLSADTIDGTLGTLSAKGGLAPAAVARGGGGGGGYIYINYMNANNFSGVGTSTVAGGAGLANGSAGVITIVQSGLELSGGAFRHKDGSYEVSCLAYLNDYEYDGEGTGLYWLDTDGPGGSSAFKAYCNMTHNGGGWTLIANRKGDGQINIESCGANLNAFFQSSCGTVSNITKSDSYNIGGSTIRTALLSQGEWLFVQYTNADVLDSDDAHIIHHGSDLFPSTTGVVSSTAVTSVCDYNNANCDSTGVLFLWSGDGYFSGSACNTAYSSSSYYGNYGYCHNGLDGADSNRLFGNRSNYDETKLWGYGSSNDEHYERIFVR